jgi:hypothetical protein
MTRVAFAILALGLPFIAVGPAHAQDPQVSKDKARLHLDMPGLQGATERYEEYGWTSNFSSIRSYAAMVASGGYPRAQVYANTLGPGFGWKPTRSLDETWLRELVPYLKDRPITNIVPTPGGTDESIRYITFGIDGAPCIGFEILGGGFVGNSNSGSRGGTTRAGVFGYYCGTKGASQLDTATINSVMAGWRVVENGAVIASPPTALLDAVKKAAVTTSATPATPKNPATSSTVTPLPAPLVATPPVTNPAAAGAGASPQQPSRSTDAAIRLQELQKLLDQKLISPGEYGAKRKAILDAL